MRIVRINHTGALGSPDRVQLSAAGLEPLGPTGGVWELSHTWSVMRVWIRVLRSNSVIKSVLIF